MSQKQNGAFVFETSLFGTELTWQKVFQNPAKIHEKKFELEKIINVLFMHGVSYDVHDAVDFDDHG